VAAAVAPAYPGAPALGTFRWSEMMLLHVSGRLSLYRLYRLEAA
jgi:hypothetical protein